MLYYCFECRKNDESKNSSVSKINNGKTIILSKCLVCDSKKKQDYERTRNNWAVKQIRH